MFFWFLGLALLAGYALLGAGWLIMKTEGELRRKALRWAKHALVLTALGVLAAGWWLLRRERRATREQRG